MPDLPVLLSAPMVRAALTGSKRMTRRVLQDRFVRIGADHEGVRMLAVIDASLRDPDGTGARLVGHTRYGYRINLTLRHAPGAWARNPWVVVFGWGAP